MSDIYFNIFHNSAVGMCIIQDFAIQLANDKMLQLLGYPPGELAKLPINKLLAQKDSRRVVKTEMQRLNGKKVPSHYEFGIVGSHNITLKVSGYFAITEFRAKPAILVQIPEGTAPGASSAVPNHTNDIVITAMENSAKYKEVIDSLSEVVFEMDPTGKITFANYRAYDFFGIPYEQSQGGIYALDYIIPSEREKVKESMLLLLQGKNIGVSEYTILRADGRTFPAIFHSNVVLRNGQPVGLRGVIVDISERKKMEEQIRRLSEYDALTGLYNRFYFENELQQLAQNDAPFGMIICDVDGLKLINDTMGHRYGDQLIIAAARAIQNTCGPENLAARIGGDEFAVILRNPDETAMKYLAQRLKEAVHEANRDIAGGRPQIPFTLSCGFAIRDNGCDSPESVFREADNNMFKEKLFHTQSNRSAVIQTLKKALEARDFITEGHAERLQTLVLQLAACIGLSENRQNDLRLFAQFHDVGKVGVPDRILFKPGPLSGAEMEIMRRHSEYGYRIAQASPDLAHIADWILKHHEWWNGGGYPLGLKGEQIPLECRILSIVDAFDAMTNDRPYRKALSLGEAMRTIKEFSGIQFDPGLVERFIEVVEYRV